MVDACLIVNSKPTNIKLEQSTYSVGTGKEKREFKIIEAREFSNKDKLKVKVYEDEKLELECDNFHIEPGGKYYFVIPAKDNSIYLFDDTKEEHHSNFKWDKEKNPDFAVVAAGSFILDENGKIAAIINDSGHFKPTSEDCTESFLRILSKNMFLSLKKNGENIESRSIEELLSKSVTSIDITKCGGVENRSGITAKLAESLGAATVVMEEKLDLINKNVKRKYQR